MNTKNRHLVVATAALVFLPIFFKFIGLTYDAATVVVILALVTMSLNLLVGYTGLVSFGHSAWFGIGGYAAALAHFIGFVIRCLCHFYSLLF